MRSLIIILFLKNVLCSDIDIKCENDRMQIFCYRPFLTDGQIISATSKGERCQFIYNKSRWSIFLI